MADPVNVGLVPYRAEAMSGRSHGRPRGETAG